MGLVEKLKNSNPMKWWKEVKALGGLVQKLLVKYLPLNLPQLSRTYTTHLCSKVSSKCSEKIYCSAGTKSLTSNVYRK